jgi:hypothetical protein
MNLAASVGAPGSVDPNLTNNFAETNILVTNYLAQLFVFTNLNIPAGINRQNGLTEQSIVIRNFTGMNMPAARVIVTGLTNQLYNAVGTNGGYPFVYYSAPLANGESETMLLQFSPRVTALSTNEHLYAFGIPSAPTWTPPATMTSGASLPFDKVVQLTNGTVLVEFPATAGQSYTVVYSDNVLFSNAMMSPPNIISPGNRAQWIDYGPPGTVSTPAKAGARFYKAYPNP